MQFSLILDAQNNLLQLILWHSILLHKLLQQLLHGILDATILTRYLSTQAIPDATILTANF